MSETTPRTPEDVLKYCKNGHYGRSLREWLLFGAWGADEVKFLNQVAEDLPAMARRVMELRELLRKHESTLLNRWTESFPNYEWTDGVMAVDLMTAEITTVRAERDKLASRVTELEALANQALTTKEYLRIHDERDKLAEQVEEQAKTIGLLKDHDAWRVKEYAEVRQQNDALRTELAEIIPHAQNHCYGLAEELRKLLNSEPAQIQAIKDHFTNTPAETVVKNAEKLLNPEPGGEGKDAK